MKLNKYIQHTVLYKVPFVFATICLFTTSCSDGEGNFAPSPVDTLYTPAVVYNQYVITDNMAAVNINLPGAPDSLADYTKYTIPQGNQYCLQTSFLQVTEDSLVFDVVFDSTAMYTTASPANQGDINKLFGFSDCSSLHQVNSARFGWRYYKNNLELWAYCYSNSIRSYTLISIININTKYTCTIVAKGTDYIFYLNHSNPIIMQRGCTGGMQYRLYPYFGGDELAPHDINIWIKKLN